jgi:hypothetical protein
MKNSGKRYIGLDVHKHYLIAVGVDDELNVVLPVRRVELSHLESWLKKTLTKQDQVALEMTTNTWQLYDELCAYAGSVLVVHPPHVALITRSQVMNDKIAASILARLLAKGLLMGVWVPPQDIRELRGLVAQRKKMTGLASEEPSARSFAATSLDATGRESLSYIAEQLVAGIAHGTAGKGECPERSGDLAVCGKTITAFNLAAGRDC